MRRGAASPTDTDARANSYRPTANINSTLPAMEMKAIPVTLYVEQTSVNAHSFQYRSIITEENSRFGKINKYTYKKRIDQISTEELNRLRSSFKLNLQQKIE